MSALAPAPTSTDTAMSIGTTRTVATSTSVWLRLFDVPLARVVALVFGYVLASLTATWPLAANITTAIPEGTEHEATVSIFSLWGLWWTADRAAHGFAGYWDAPFFHPARGVTAYSEPFPLVGLAVGPLWGLDLPPALIYNIALLGLLTLNGLFTYRLLRALDIAVVPASLGGLLAITLPFVAKVQGALPLAAVFGIPWTLEGLVRFAKTGSTRWAAWAGMGLVATYLTCQQYALVFGPVLVGAEVIALAQHRFARRPTLRLFGAMLVSALVVGLVALPGLRVRSDAGFRRSEDLVQALSARPGDFLTRPGLATVSFPASDPSDTGGLFPGFLVFGLATVGLVGGARHRATRRWTIFVAASVATSALVAMALNVELGGWHPFATARAIIPGLAELRSPTRATTMLQLCLVILATLGLAAMWSRMPRKGATLVALLGVLAAAENVSIPLRLTTVPLSTHTEWADWLRDQGPDTVVAHIPFPAGLHVSDYEVEAWRMFAQIDHQKPIVNGYSGNFPQLRSPLGAVVPVYTQFQLAIAQQFPTEQLLCILQRSQDVNTLVVDRGWLEGHATQLAEFSSFIEPAYGDEQVQIYRLQAPAGRCSPS